MCYISLHLTLNINLLVSILNKFDSDLQLVLCNYFCQRFVFVFVLCILYVFSG